MVLIGQPPEVLKGLLRAQVPAFDTLVLSDVREKDGSLVNNLEFPLYYFLFVAGGMAEGRRLKLVGDEIALSQAMRLLRLTLLGPTEAELDAWETEPALKQEWLSVARHLALRGADGAPLEVEDFFELITFEDGVSHVGELEITQLGPEQYRFDDGDSSAEIDLAEDTSIDPTYTVRTDYIPGGLVKLGLEVLGGASGFAVDEPCTGLALCFNGDYLLIDALPFLDQNLFARGIAKNQISAVFLTHLHDDHCALFPLIMMPHRVDVITTREIFNMTMEKLACNLGWQPSVIAEHFNLVEVRPGEETNYFGLNIEPHVTVHSIPTVGATFSMLNDGKRHRICVVGDNNSMDTVREMASDGLVRAETLERLERLYRERFDLLIADGGAGAIHGDPADAIASEAHRVVFVHVDELSPEFTTTFSLASAGKRYTVLEGNDNLYTSQVNHFLTKWLGRSFPNRWMRSLLAEEEIRRYNQDDVILVQAAETRGHVFLVLTGYCDVVRHDGQQSNVVANLQAGDIIGEMAVITGRGVRNASVVARSPVSICVFSEEIFRAFIESEGVGNELLERWAIRPVLKSQPVFEELSSTMLEKLGRIARIEPLEAGDTRRFEKNAWYFLIEGSIEEGGATKTGFQEFGWRPFLEDRVGPVTCIEDCRFVRIRQDDLEALRLEAPQLNYVLRKFRMSQLDDVDWALGLVTTT